MSLDLWQIAKQIEGMVAKLQAGKEEKRRKLEFALHTLHSEAKRLDFLKQKIETSKTTWLVAELGDNFSFYTSAPSCPNSFIVLATDGSHIDVDRHRSTRCFVINIGMVLLEYGQKPKAFLHSSPFLYFEETEVALNSSDEQVMFERPLVTVKRSIEECRLLAQLAKEVEANLPIVALLDGSLILWGLTGQAYPDFVVESFLEKGLLKYLEELRKLSEDKHLALASYISFPRSTEVINALRLAICPYEPANCDHYCPGKFSGRECDKVSGLLDRELFDQLLAIGERSAIFASRSSIVKEHYGEHRVYFFYLKTEREIVRLEIPEWVAKDKKLINLLHSIVLDQCRRGQGYPVALSEAHEKAVITATDREQFWQLLERSLIKEERLVKTSAKSWSKRARWV